MTMVATKDEIARKLADAHYDLSGGVESIYRLSKPGKEEDPEEPVKLLEVDNQTIASGIMPLFFRPANGIIYPSVVVDVTPEEFSRICSGALKLPHGWMIGEKLERRAGDN